MDENGYNQKIIEFVIEGSKLLTEQKQLAEEIKLLTKKHRQAFNGLVGAALVVFMPVLFAFVNLNVSVTEIKDKQLPKDDIYNKFVQKVDALAVHQLEGDWVKTQFYKITKDDYYKTDETTKKIIEAFYNSDSRSATN